MNEKERLLIQGHREVVGDTGLLAQGREHEAATHIFLVNTALILHNLQYHIQPW